MCQEGQNPPQFTVAMN